MTVTGIGYRALMGKNNKVRRAAKAKSKAQAKAKAQEKARRRERMNGRGGSGGHAGPGGEGGPFGDSYREDLEGLAYGLLHDASWFQYQESNGVGCDETAREATLAHLGRVAPAVLTKAGERAILSRLGQLWDSGWQPAEVLRQARLSGKRAVTTRLVGHGIAGDDSRRRAVTMDIRWIAQLEAMDLPDADGKPGWIRRWTRSERLDAVAVRETLVDVLSVMWLPPVEMLIPPPGSKGAAQSGRTLRDATTSERDPLLERIRALLAKAESTNFEQEAMAFTTKAQELITRHAIDSAMLADAEGTAGEEPSIIRVPLDPPYWDAKGLMLQIVAERTRCRALMMSGLNMSRVVGYPADLEAVEMLFTSLLIQAQTALVQAGRSAPPGTRTRSTSYRSTFLVAYAGRIGERLAEINAAVASDVTETRGDSFLPVLRAREDAIDDYMNERYGDSSTKSVRGGYDPAATAHGRMAADSAQLNFGDVGSDRPPIPDGTAAPRAALPAT